MPDSSDEELEEAAPSPASPEMQDEAQGETLSVAVVAPFI